eukprot:TRINITY_DN7723_c0_g2_i1.p1 TRINITY_DN7723_c0_g2~~TRINITY_DN7723_c0_g2_i1.p1  ORF type:complete len:862 (+),score=67.95 TRINITY_DN7723_c0_g2_i1:44-2587(+)
MQLGLSITMDSVNTDDLHPPHPLLCDDILHNIFFFLDTRSVVISAMVCGQWQRLLLGEPKEPVRYLSALAYKLDRVLQVHKEYIVFERRRTYPAPCLVLRSVLTCSYVGVAYTHPTDGLCILHRFAAPLIDGGVHSAAFAHGLLVLVRPTPTVAMHIFDAQELLTKRPHLIGTVMTSVLDSPPNQVVILQSPAPFPRCDEMEDISSNPSGIINGTSADLIIPISAGTARVTPTRCTRLPCIVLVVTLDASVYVFNRFGVPLRVCRPQPTVAMGAPPLNAQIRGHFVSLGPGGSPRAPLLRLCCEWNEDDGRRVTLLLEAALGTAPTDSGPAPLAVRARYAGIAVQTPTMFPSDPLFCSIQVDTWTASHIRSTEGCANACTEREGSVGTAPWLAQSLQRSGHFIVLAQVRDTYEPLLFTNPFSAETERDVVAVCATKQRQAGSAYVAHIALIHRSTLVVTKTNAISHETWTAELAAEVVCFVDNSLQHIVAVHVDESYVYAVNLSGSRVSLKIWTLGGRYTRAAVPTQEITLPWRGWYPPITLIPPFQTGSHLVIHSHEQLAFLPCVVRSRACCSIQPFCGIQAKFNILLLRRPELWTLWVLVIANCDFLFALRYLARSGLPYLPLVFGKLALLPCAWLPRDPHLPAFLPATVWLAFLSLCVTASYYRNTQLVTLIFAVIFAACACISVLRLAREMRPHRWRYLFGCLNGLLDLCLASPLLFAVHDHSFAPLALVVIPLLCIISTVISAVLSFHYPDKWYHLPAQVLLTPERIILLHSGMCMQLIFFSRSVFSRMVFPTYLMWIVGEGIAVRSRRVFCCEPLLQEYASLDSFCFVVFLWVLFPLYLLH